MIKQKIFELKQAFQSKNENREYERKEIEAGLEGICLEFSIPVSTLVTGPDDAEMLHEKIDYARSFSGIPEELKDKPIPKLSDYSQSIKKIYAYHRIGEVKYQIF